MIEFEHVGLRYGIGPEILRDINFELEPGTFNFFTGKSGAGKTSLMRLLYIGKQPSRGAITAFERNITHCSREELSKLRQKIGVVFQDFRLINHMTAYENIALPLRIMNKSEKEISQNVEELLDWVDLKEFSNYLPSTLSGGQQQRIAIARAVITKPKLLLADEPTGNLDDNIGQKLMKLFSQLNKMGTTVVIATHSQSIMNEFQYPIMYLDKGELTIKKRIWQMRA